MSEKVRKMIRPKEMMWINDPDEYLADGLSIGLVIDKSLVDIALAEPCGIDKGSVPQQYVVEIADESTYAQSIGEIVVAAEELLADAGLYGFRWQS